jgi:hypothetical protein
MVVCICCACKQDYLCAHLNEFDSVNGTNKPHVLQTKIVLTLKRKYVTVLR